MFDKVLDMKESLKLTRRPLSGHFTIQNPMKNHGIALSSGYPIAAVSTGSKVKQRLESQLL
jgi:hypothetical protein